MPFDAWLLLIVSVGLGLGLEIMFIWARRGDRVLAPSSVHTSAPDRASAPGSDE
jgi:hypothetical protein